MTGEKSPPADEFHTLQSVEFRIVPVRKPSRQRNTRPPKLDIAPIFNYPAA
jgi:hypothetical protein